MRERRSGELHAWRRRLELEEAGSWRKRLRIRRLAMGRGISALRRVARAIASSGRVVRERDKVSLTRQFLGQWWCLVRHGLVPRDYYQYRLHAPDNRGRAGLYLRQEHLFALLRPLAPGPDFWDKGEFFRDCRARGLKTIPLLAEWRDRRLVVCSDEWPREVYSKPAMGCCGIGVRAWKDARAELERFLAGQADTVVQPRIFNHPELAGLSSGSLCTLRLNGCRTPAGEVELLLPALRMPVGGSVVDNFAQGNLVAPVDLDRGSLGPAVRLDRDGVVCPVPRHPQSGQAIEGRPVPMLAEAVDLFRRAHAAFPDSPLVGWDVAITADGPLLVEGNYIFSSDVPQVAHNRPLGETVFVESLLHHLEKRREAAGRARASPAPSPAPLPADRSGP